MSTSVTSVASHFPSPQNVNTDDCWLWARAKHPLGYGHIKVNGKVEYAHRVVYEALVGPIPEGISLDPLCRTPACVNPEHLEPVTHRTNVLRGSGPTAANALKLYCKNGHILSGVNLKMVGPNKERRMCHTCAKAQWRTISKTKYAKKAGII